MDEARALLDSLMGHDRNMDPGKRRPRHYTDDDVCRSYLLGLCPHTLFTNTRVDLGPCNRTHADKLRSEFWSDVEHAPYYRHKWRGEHRIELLRLLDAVDRRIAINRSRIIEGQATALEISEKQQKQIAGLREDMAEMMRKAEAAADANEFEESQRLMKETEVTKKKIEDLSMGKQERDRFAWEKKICEVCGVIVDVEEIESIKTGRGWHEKGKQHMGYKEIRTRLKEIEEQDALEREGKVPIPTRPPDLERVEAVKSERRGRERTPRSTRKSSSCKKRGSSGEKHSRRQNGRRSRSRERIQNTHDKAKHRKSDEKWRKTKRSRSRRSRKKRRRSSARRSISDSSTDGEASEHVSSSSTTDSSSGGKHRS